MHLVTVKGLHYHLPDGRPLLKNIHFTLQQNKYGLIGRNGSGKSMLFKLLTGQVQPDSGQIIRNGRLGLMPQLHEVNRNQTISSFLGIEPYLKALQRMNCGEVGESDLLLLDGKWLIEEESQLFLQSIGLANFHLHTPLSNLSGGALCKLVLGFTLQHKPDLLLLDEPTNHLDRPSRHQFYEMIEHYEGALLLISHDRELLRYCNQMLVMSDGKLTHYEVGFDRYKEQEAIREAAAQHQLQHAEKELKKAKKVMQESLAKQEKRSVRGEKQAISKGDSRLAIHIKKGSAEATMARLKEQHVAKLLTKQTQWHSALEQQHVNTLMELKLPESTLTKGKKVVALNEVNRYHHEKALWHKNLNWTVKAGEHWHIQGSNGSGKTSLLRLLTDSAIHCTGEKWTSPYRVFCIDQHLSIHGEEQTLLHWMKQLARSGLTEAYIRTVLAHLLFTEHDMGKGINQLSGGERLRLLLASFLVSPPTDVLILDEPTNNLDMESVEQLIAALRQYKGTLLVVSHDAYFVNQLGVSHVLNLDDGVNT